MYANNSIGRRRPEGWVERRRLFKKLFPKARPEAALKPTEKDKKDSK